VPGKNVLKITTTHKGLFCMKKLRLLLLTFIFLYAQSLSAADCRGCCSHNGGVICVDGVTVCADGTALSAKCTEKGCSICADAALDTITIASFNIQVFGRAKASKIKVMKNLAETISHFDLIAIQEIRDSSGTAVKALEKAVDSIGDNYDVIVGPRLGRTSSKEQYAFIYKSHVIEIQDFYTYSDRLDIFHREPFIVHCKVVGKPFDFAVINIHTDPDEATDEINNLTNVISDTKEHFSEKDIILMGDLNADGAYYDERNTALPLRDDAFIWLIRNEADTTVAASSNAYDRIIITAASAEDYLVGTARVFKFDQEIKLNCAPKELSDHYPVFATFRVDNDMD
jgi:endonuclease/exonuclease/phosphatase family metal-dependent hydrolase